LREQGYADLQHGSRVLHARFAGLVPLQLVVKGLETDAKGARRPLLVPAMVVQRCKDQAALRLGDGRADRDAHARVRRALGLGQLRERQVRRLDVVAVGEDRRAMDAVLELAHVAGPAVLAETRERVAREAFARPLGLVELVQEVLG